MMKKNANKNELMDECLERLEFVVKHYFNEMLEMGMTPVPIDWISAYDCFCGCYGDEFDFGEEVEDETQRIWDKCLAQYRSEK